MINVLWKGLDGPWYSYLVSASGWCLPSMAGKNPIHRGSCCSLVIRTLLQVKRSSKISIKQIATVSPTQRLPLVQRSSVLGSDVCTTFFFWGKFFHNPWILVNSALAKASDKKEGRKTVQQKKLRRRGKQSHLWTRLTFRNNSPTKSRDFDCWCKARPPAENGLSLVVSTT